MDGAEAGNEVMFKGLDGSFGGISAVVACWGKLVFYVVRTDFFFH